jgi:hypothetical protein
MQQTPSVTFKKHRTLESFGLRISITPKGFEIIETNSRPDCLLLVEVYHNGMLLKREHFHSCHGWRDACVELNPCECGLRVLDNAGDVVAILDVEEDLFQFMRPNGEQRHITESYVAVPPALTITDETGAIWTLDQDIAPRHKSPDGEFAFTVLRNGVSCHEIASRIERRGGKIKIFTSHGWKVWTGQSFF